VTIAAAVGRLWLAGVQIEWPAIHGEAVRRHLSLPTYPFERQRYFADLPAGVPVPLTTAATDGEAPVEDAAASASPGRIEQKETSEPAHLGQSEVAEDDALTQLKQLLINLSGLDLAEVSATTNLLELGFDSLFLSQIALGYRESSG